MRARVVAGSATLVAVNIAIALVGVANIAIVARLLGPEDFGLIAYAFIVLEMAKVFSELHVTNAFIRLGSIGESHYRTAFTIALLRGLILGLGLYLTSGTFAAVFDEPRLAAILQVMAILPVLDGLASPRMIDFVRDIDFRREAFVSVLSRVLVVASTVAAALMLNSYWAFVIGTTIGTLFSLAITYRFAPWRPRLGLEHWRAVLTFGGWLNATSIVGFFNKQANKLVVGQFLGTATLGVYSVGEQMATMVTSQLSMPFSRAIYSGLARFEADLDRLKAAYYRSQSAVVAIVLPIGVGTGLVADHAVRALVGAQWLDAVIVVQFVAPIIAMTMIVSGVHALLMVAGRTRTIFVVSLVILAVRVPVLVIGMYLYGLIGLLTARVVTGLFQIASYLHVARRVTDDAMLTPVLRAWRSFVACGFMVLAVQAVGWGLAAPGGDVVGQLAMLLAKAGAGGMVYGLAHLGLWLAAGRPDGVEQTAMDTLAGLAARWRGRRVRGRSPA